MHNTSVDMPVNYLCHCFGLLLLIEESGGRDSLSVRPCVRRDRSVPREERCLARLWWGLSPCNTANEAKSIFTLKPKPQNWDSAPHKVLRILRSGKVCSWTFRHFKPPTFYVQ